MNILPKIIKNDDQIRYQQAKQKLKRRHAKLGAQVFGPVPKGHERQFFCLDKYSWVWYEGWKDSYGNKQSLTTRYDIRPNGIFKVQNGGGYQRLTNAEIKNLCEATDRYVELINKDYQASFSFQT
jgi:hypothetical protein